MAPEKGTPEDLYFGIKLGHVTRELRVERLGLPPCASFRCNSPAAGLLRAANLIACERLRRSGARWTLPLSRLKGSTHPRKGMENQIMWRIGQGRSRGQRHPPCKKQIQKINSSSSQGCVQKRAGSRQGWRTIGDAFDGQLGKIGTRFPDRARRLERLRDAAKPHAQLSEKPEGSLTFWHRGSSTCSGTERSCTSPVAQHVDRSSHSRQ